MKKTLTNIALILGIASAVLVMSMSVGIISASAATTWTCNSAVLEGDMTVNPAGISTLAWFNWGTTQSFGNTTAQQTIISTGGTQVFNQAISGLSPNTTYWYQAVGQNNQGNFFGQIFSFTTSACGTTNNQLSVITRSPNILSSSSVTFNGYVDPQGASNTTAWFEWGTNPNTPMGNITPSQNYGGSPMAFSYTVSNLAANTTYYYRAVAQNASGTVYGNIVTMVPVSNTNSGYFNYPTFATGGLADGWGNMVFGSGSGYYSGYNNGCTTNCGTGGCYTNCGTNYNVNTYGNQPVVNTYSPNASGNYAVLNGYVDPNGNQNVTRWFEWGTNQYSLSNKTNKSNQSYAGTFSDNVINLVNNTTYYYRAVAQGNSGTTYGQVMSFTTGTGGSTYNYSLGTQSYTGSATVLAVTNLPSLITQTTARMNGQAVLQNTGTPTNGWFEWGTSNSLGNTTQTKNVGSDATNVFNEYLSDLSANTTYYYRAVVQNQYGIFKGDIVSFSTHNPVTEVAVSSASTVSSVSAVSIKTSSAKPSLINLTVSSDNESVCRGDNVTLSINYVNASNEILRDVVIRVSMPKELSFVDSNKGIYSDKDNVVTVAVGMLTPGESGIIVVKADVRVTPASDKTLLSTASAVYTRENGVQEETIGYTTQNPSCLASRNTAAAFWSGSFLPNTLLGWLLLIIIILILIVLSRHLYGTYREGKTDNK